MNPPFRHKFSPLQAARAGGVLMLAGLGLFLGGCKGNSSSAASPEPVVGSPPSVKAVRAAEDLRDADPLTSPAWHAAAWYDFSAPISTPEMTPPTRGAFLYDAEHLYVAFVCQKSPAPPAGADAAIRDTVALYLDPRAQGTELLQIAVDASPAQPRCTWFRASGVAQPRQDGSPDLAFPMDTVPLKNGDLWCVLREGRDGHAAVWTAVLGIPLTTLPGPLRTVPVASGGVAWKVNLLRTVTTNAGGKRIGQVQSNLSPVYMDAQPVSPYRLAELRFLP